ncbi:hypothetical protein CC1G_10389 [Coprinopsis cinerea okayama7|uniref:Uncharacterized protein n=1 Tax=Coprinopsis cinerea (strain Okayama-7 / 130 / ATCC MYA-4618 / FGSC 9003) TaxID=240176 RepID=A8PAL3_COPC7|nr:hypothetical protein CC1G_10389 [Coprinopsis cinerea okayama7\|eukprot:XP_001840005.2 hypothetical protein CC1G_10389 [Coprinopsis cinerea okayama7\
MATFPTYEPPIAAFVHAPENTLLRLDVLQPPTVVGVTLNREELSALESSTLDYAVTAPRHDWTYDFKSVFEPWLSRNGYHGPMFNVGDMAQSPEYCEGILQDGYEIFLNTIPDVLPSFVEELFGSPFIKVCLDFLGAFQQPLEIFCDDDDGKMRTRGWMAWRIASLVLAGLKDLVEERKEFEGYQPENFRILGMLHLFEYSLSVPVLVYAPRRV